MAIQMIQACCLLALPHPSDVIWRPRRKMDYNVDWLINNIFCKYPQQGKYTIANFVIFLMRIRHQGTVDVKQ